MFHIEPVRPEHWNQALELALMRMPDADRAVRVQHCRQLLENGVLDVRGLWAAWSDGVMIGVQVCVPLAGAACVFWLPSGRADCQEALVQAGLNWCRSMGCKVAHAMVGENDLPFTKSLQACGFQVITRMHQLERSLDHVPGPASNLRFENCGPHNESIFADTLARTYLGSLDCPELNGKRSLAEVLAGHRGQGTYHPEQWWLAYRDDKPVGVAILVELPDATSWELAYLGTVPEHRRAGVGRALTIHALRALRSVEPVLRMVVAVDERNAPARRLYDSLGFVEFECNQVLLYFW